MNNIILSFIARLQPSMVRLLEGLSETLRFSIFSSLFLLSLYFLSYNFLYHKVYSLFLSLHPKNKTLAHLPLSVGNHPRVVLHQVWCECVEDNQRCLGIEHGSRLESTTW